MNLTNWERMAMQGFEERMLLAKASEANQSKSSQKPSLLDRLEWHLGGFLVVLGNGVQGLAGKKTTNQSALESECGCNDQNALDKLQKVC